MTGATGAVRAALAAALLAAAVAAAAAPETRAEPAAAQAEAPPQRFTVKVTEPADGDYVFGKVRIAAEVKSREPVKGIRVEFSIGGKLGFIDREPPFECSHDFGDQPRSYVVEARAIAPDGAAVSDVVVTRKLDIHYREEVERVVVTLSITDAENAFVEGLTRDDFKVSEDGRPQQILEFGVETRPLTLGVLIDTSGSMKEEIEDVQEAASDFVETVRPEDRAFVVDLDENVFLLQDLTNDHALLQAAIEGTDAEGGTALYDAVWASYRLMKGIQGRRALIALTDGEDTNSRTSFQRLLELTRTSDVILYPVALDASVLDFPIRGSLRQLADDTGGRAFFPRSAEDIARAYRQIAADLRSQYFLTYTPSNGAADGKWRAIRVECRVPGVNIKTRRGYYAVRR